jgi:hypothetical protein
MYFSLGNASRFAAGEAVCELEGVGQAEPDRCQISNSPAMIAKEKASGVKKCSIYGAYPS